MRRKRWNAEGFGCLPRLFVSPRPPPISRLSAGREQSTLHRSLFQSVPPPSERVHPALTCLLGTIWRTSLSVAAAAVLAALPAQPQRAPEWPDALLTRTQALALVQSLNAEILASRSATATLQKWCGDHGLAREPRVVAEVVSGETRAPTAEQRQ